MNSITESPAFAPYALAATVLAVHMLLLALWTGTVRTMRKVWVNPEDAKLNKGQQVEAEHGDTARVKRAHQNALENAVPFFAIGLLYVATGATHTGAVAYFGTFTAVRLLHSVFYLWGRQPFRTMMFAIGVLALFGMSAHILMTVI